MCVACFDYLAQLTNLASLSCEPRGFVRYI